MESSLYARLDLMEIYLSSLENIQNNLNEYFYLLRSDFKNVGKWNDATYEKTEILINQLKKKLYDLFLIIKEVTETFELYIEDLEDYNDTSRGRFGRL